MKNRIVAGFGVVALLAALSAGSASAASAASGGGVYYYKSLSVCQQAVDKLAQRYTIVQGCTADVHQNGVPVRWRVMFDMK